MAALAGGAGAGFGVAAAVGQLAAAPAVEPERKGQEGGDEEQDDEGRKVHG